LETKLQSESFDTLDDLDSSLVSNNNFSKTFWPSGWALGQVTQAKIAQNYFTYDVTHKRSKTLTKIFFFECRLEDWPIVFESLNSSLA